MRILIVEDDGGIADVVAFVLQRDGYETQTASDGDEAIRRFDTFRPDLVLLDLGLPGMGGLDLFHRFRRMAPLVPVIIATSRNEESDRIAGLEMGADDYVTKPFSVDELLARLKAVLLRGDRQASGPRKLSFDDVELDLDARTMTRGGHEVVMTRTEFDLLAYFIENEGKALSRDTVMNDVWGLEYFGTQRSLDSFVANLRKKIEKDPHHPVHIHTVHGVGYKFQR